MEQSFTLTLRLAVDGRSQHVHSIDEAIMRFPRRPGPDQLVEPLELVGPVSTTIHLESALDHVDVFVRVCDVHPDGASLNVCDALQRFTTATIERDADGVFTAEFDLWPIGHRFGAGHRLRVQVSSGSHPVYARNLGTGEPVATAIDMLSNDVAVHHAPGRASKVVLPHLR